MTPELQDAARLVESTLVETLLRGERLTPDLGREPKTAEMGERIRVALARARALTQPGAGAP